jgi:lipopolysaccharide heptosyltransferase I
MIRLPNDELRRILIIKPSSLGDIVDAMPAVGAIRRRFKTAHLAWLVKAEWASILAGNPSIHQVISVPFRWRLAGQIIESVRANFDLVVDLQGLLRSALLSRASGAPERVGFSDAREGATFFYTRTVVVPPSTPHAVDRCLAVAAALGAEIDRPLFDLPSSPEAQTRVRQFLRDAGLAEDRALPVRVRGVGASKECQRRTGPHVKWEGAIVVFHATARWNHKRWPPERFAKLADAVAQQGTTPIFIGAASERKEIDRIGAMMARPLVNAAGALTLPESAELLRRAAFCICNDSGPMHLAAAVGTPTIALFGPTDPKRVGPYGTGHRVIQKGIDCSGCGRNACVRDNACMKAIEVDEVCEAAKTIG